MLGQPLTDDDLEKMSHRVDQMQYGNNTGSAWQHYARDVRRLLDAIAGMRREVKVDERVIEQREAIDAYVEACHSWMDEALGDTDDYSADALRLRVESLVKTLDSVRDQFRIAEERCNHLQASLTAMRREAGGT